MCMMNVNVKENLSIELQKIIASIYFLEKFSQLLWLNIIKYMIPGVQIN